MNDEEEDIVEELMTRLTGFYTEAMLDAGISTATIKEIRLGVAMRMVNDIESAYLD